MADPHDPHDTPAPHDVPAPYDTPAPPPPSRRRRADARRSIDAILNATRVVLGERPDASMEDIAAAAGVTRQTVYAHFSSREVLVAALVEVASAEFAALLDEAALDTAPPADALTRYLDAGWRFLDRYPLLLHSATAQIPRPAHDPHDFVPPRLARLVRRGQYAGDFDPALPADWLAAAILGLQHTAVDQVAAGLLTNDKAAELCAESALRLCGGQAQP